MSASGVSTCGIGSNRNRTSPSGSADWSVTRSRTPDRPALRREPRQLSFERRQPTPSHARYRAPTMESAEDKPRQGAQHQRQPEKANQNINPDVIKACRRPPIRPLAVLRLSTCRGHDREVRPRRNRAAAWIDRTRNREAQDTIISADHPSSMITNPLASATARSFLLRIRFLHSTHWIVFKADRPIGAL